MHVAVASMTATMAVRVVVPSMAMQRICALSAPLVGMVVHPLDSTRRTGGRTTRRPLQGVEDLTPEYGERRGSNKCQATVLHAGQSNRAE
jgi:hypothetical protein